MKHFVHISLIFSILCACALPMMASTDCTGYKDTYPDHYCDCNNPTRIYGLSELQDLNFSDSIWFKTSITTFTEAGMTAYLFSESDVQVDIYQNCRTFSKAYSFLVPKNQTRDMDHQTILDKLEQNGVSGLNAAIYVLFYPVEDGADCRLMCYPYNTGPNSTADAPLPMLVGMTYVSSHAYDVYELKAENIPASCALYTQWKEASDLTCNLTITRGSVDGEVVAEHDFLDASTYFRFDPNLLAEVRKSGESLYMHYHHDASAAGRIITREATLTEEVTDLALCQGKTLEAYDTVYTTPDIVVYDRAWVGNSLKVCEYKYNLTFTEPVLQYDTLRVHVSDMPILYRGQYTIPVSGACDFDCLIRHDDECDEHYLLHVIRENDDYATVCYGESYEWNGTIYSESGSYTKTLQSALGCDSIVTLHLTVLPEISATDEVITVCGGDGYLWEATGETYYASGDYKAVIQNENGCDSMVILHLNVLPAEDVVTNQTICQGESWVWDVTGEAYGTIIKNTTFNSNSDKSSSTSVTKDGITIAISNGTIGNGYYDITANNTLTISSSVGAISNVEITCAGQGTNRYGPGNLNSVDGTYNVSGNVGTWTGNANQVVFTALKKPVRAYTIIVTFVDGSVVEGTVSVPRTNDYGCEVNYILNWKLQDCSVPDCEDQVVEYTVNTCGAIYTWKPGLEYTESGVYYDSLTTALGCDSVEILYLTINKPVATAVAAVACDSYTWNGTTYTESGEYIYTTTAANGCDSVVTLRLTINKTQYAEVVATTCDTYTWNGEVYTESGEYIYTTTAVNGCDSVVTLRLTINKTQYAEVVATACDTYTWNGEVYAESGEYVYTTTAANGCDSIVTLHLTINQSEVSATESATICYGETYTWNGQTYSTEGEYSVILSNVNGCDSVATLHLTIMPKAVVDTETMVVGSDALPYQWRGNDYVATGRYTDVEQYLAVACDSAIHYLDLTVLTTGNFDEQSVTICDSEAPYVWYDQSYAVTGKYTYTEQYIGTDIDSIQHILNLTVNPTVYTEETVTACDSYTWNGTTYTESGEYIYTTTAKNGCDSVVTLHLTINKTQYAEETATACDSYTWNGNVYTESGEYVYTTTAANGCDSVVTLHLTINKTQYAEEQVTACDSYTWNGKMYTESGEYVYTTTAQNGCDSVVSLHLIINKTQYAEETVTACDSYTWNGATYSESGEYVYTTTAANGCDSVVNLYLTINNTQYAEVAAIACDTYTWNGEVYTESGEYVFTTTAKNGCDSVVTLHLTINKTQYAEERVTACDSYTWNGETYTESGEYVYTTTAKNGCDSVVTLHLTINKTQYAEERVTACDSYTWNGETYTESGEYVYTTTAQNGCDSVVTLHLTINTSSLATDEYATICYGASLPWNGGIYSATGDYTIIMSNAVGCDSVVTLHLTVLPEAVSDTLVAIVGSDKLPYIWRDNGYYDTGLYAVEELYATRDCDSAIHILDLTVLKADLLDEQRLTICETEVPYMWYDQKLSQSGKYTYIEQYVGTDIDSVQHVLTLTINPTVYSIEEVSICEGETFTWNDVAYTEAGEYIATLNSVLTGCDSIATLRLTVNKTQYAEEQVTACDSYDWNGATYTESGEYIYTTTADNGCDSVVTLRLTINKTQYAEEQVTACDSYDWNGATYTESGEYIYTTTADNGCDSVVTLRLTVNKTQYADEQVTACDSYTWNGEVYTESGEYVYTTTAANGCDSIVTLQLTINKTQYAEEIATACDSYTWNGETYTESGEYIYTTTAQNGCDSVVTLHLTVLPSAIVEEEQVIVCESELPYVWYEHSCAESGKYYHSEPYAGTDMDSVIYTLTLDIYKTSLPSSVTLPVVRVGEPIDVSVPNAEIQAYIETETWYAPNTLISWYLKKEGEWTNLTDEPVVATTTELIMKYSVDSDCGRTESDDITVRIVATSVEDTVKGDAVTVKKVIIHDKVFIIRGDNMYSLMGIEVK